MLENEDVYKPAGPKIRTCKEPPVMKFHYQEVAASIFACFGQRVRVRIAPVTPVENCIEEFSELLIFETTETMNCASMDGILRSSPRRPSQTPTLKMNSCSYRHIGRCITPHNFLVATCQSRGGLCRKNCIFRVRLRWSTMCTQTTCRR